MLKTWSWLNADKTEIVQTWREKSEPLTLLYPDGEKRQGMNHPDDVLIFSGALLHDYDVPGKFQYEDKGNFIIEQDRINQAIITRSDEYIKAELIKQTEKLSDSKVNEIAPARKVARAIATGSKISWKKIKHLSKPNQEPDLTPEEEATATFLDNLAGQTEAIRVAEDQIIIEINNALGQDLIDFDVAGHIIWP